MRLSARYCENGHQCTNKSVCTNNKHTKLDFNCDCDEKNVDQSWDELICEHKGIVEYCASAPPPPTDSYDTIYSPISFCANMGTCKAKITPEES